MDAGCTLPLAEIAASSEEALEAMRYGHARIVPDYLGTSSREVLRAPLSESKRLWVPDLGTSASISKCIWKIEGFTESA